MGIIAGSQALPRLFAQHARNQGINRIVAVGFHGETDPELKHSVDDLVWLKVGQLSKMLRAFKERGVKQCVMLGQIAPKNLFDLGMDLRAMSLLWRLKERNAHTIFGAIADELEKEGITLVEPTPWLGPLMPGAGFRLGQTLSPAQADDVQFGYRLAKEIARLDIGQTIVVKSGTVLAVEGFEGTDQCLERGGRLAGPRGGAVAVKVAKQNHDFRFDIPCIGPQTIKVCLASGVSALAVEQHRTLLLEQEKIEQLLMKAKMGVVTTG